MPTIIDNIKLYKPWNSENGTLGAKGGNKTDDRIFLLSWTEARDYLDGKLVKDLEFHSPKPEDYNSKMLCKPTAYAKAQNEYIEKTYTNDDNEYPSDTVGCCNWLLRSPGSVQQMATGVYYNGALQSFSVHNLGYGVRPAILID